MKHRVTSAATDGKTKCSSRRWHFRIEVTATSQANSHPLRRARSKDGVDARPMRIGQLRSLGLNRVLVDDGGLEGLRFMLGVMHRSRSSALASALRISTSPTG